MMTYVDRIQRTPAIGYKAAVAGANTLLFCVLQFAYNNFMVVQPSPYKLDFSDANFVFSLILVPALSFFLAKEDRPSRLFTHIGMVGVIIPTLTLVSGRNLPVAFSASAIIGFLIIVTVCRFVKIPQYSHPILSNKAALDICAAAVFLYVASLVWYVGFRFLNVDFGNVYSIRAELPNYLPSIYRYITPNITQAILPFGVVFALVLKRYAYLIFFVVCSAGVFLLTATKGPLFFPVFVIGIYFLTSFKRIFLIISMASLVTISFSTFDLYLYFNGGSPANGWLGEIFIDRIFLLPSLLNYFYYDFFSQHQPYLWSESRLTFGLIDRPFDMPSPKLIGSVYFPDNSPFANTGWIGSGYAQARMLGVLAYSVGVGCVFAYVDTVARRIGTRIAIGVFAVQAVHLLNSIDFVTSFLTGGLAVSIVLASLITPQNGEIAPGGGLRA